MMIGPGGEIRTDEQVQEMIRLTIEREGRFILCSPVPVEIGQVEMFAGLPFRVVRLVDHGAYLTNGSDIWGVEPCSNRDHYAFEVEVAD